MFAFICFIYINMKYKMLLLNNFKQGVEKFKKFVIFYMILLIYLILTKLNYDFLLKKVVLY